MLKPIALKPIISKLLLNIILFIKISNLYVFVGLPFLFISRI